MIRSLLTLRKLFHAAKEHRQVESQIDAIYRAMLDSRYQGPEKNKKNSLQYLQQNFFSSLFLSIYQAIGIPPEKRLFYGKINHCIRGIVTGTDNILDNEYKEMLPLNFPEPAIRFKSVMHILCFDRILETLIRQAAESGLIGADTVADLHQAIFRDMVPIGAEEAMEEGGVTTVLTPAEILKSVHMYKGGKLLCLSFAAPALLEKELQHLLKPAQSGVYRIGMALQVIDDITDFYEDIENANHNYMLSAVHHEGSKSEQQILAAIMTGENVESSPVEEIFRDTLETVMARAIGEAVSGFSDLATAGYWFNQKQAIRIIRFLFQVRGVGRLLPFFPKNDQLLSLHN